METVQLALLFTCGYLVSRLFVVLRVPENIVHRLVTRKIRLSTLLLLLTALSAGLSVLIPNAITAITLLPVITLLQRQWAQHRRDHQARVTTALALAVIYGANIGGTGAVTATPANGVLAAYASLNAVPTGGLLRFDHWLAWGLPLTVLLALLGWAVIMLTLVNRHATEVVEPLAGWKARRDPAQGLALALAGLFFTGAFALSWAMSVHPEEQVLALTGAFTVIMLVLLFGLPLRPLDDGGRGRLLRPRDVAAGMPTRGLLFVAGFVLLAGTLFMLGTVKAMAGFLAQALPADLDGFGATLLLALTTTFSTELLSNTVVQLGMFETILEHGGGTQLIYPLLVTTLSCTCAFMSPLATGVNGLVFGEMRGASLWRMLIAGLVMNLASALVISAWVSWVIR